MGGIPPDNGFAQKNFSSTSNEAPKASKEVCNNEVIDRFVRRGVSSIAGVRLFRPIRIDGEEQKFSGNLIDHIRKLLVTLDFSR